MERVTNIIIYGTQRNKMKPKSIKREQDPVERCNGGLCGYI